MASRRWLTKDEKRLLAAHAGRYSEMFNHVQETDTDHLYELLAASLACTTSNCWWAEYAAAQHLIKEIRGELAWRWRRDAEAVEQTDPIAHREMQWADDGGLVFAM